MKEIIIELSDEQYNAALRNAGWVGNDLYRAVKNGTPLPKGRWIKHSGWNDDTYNTEYSCSECNEWVHVHSNFCPNCGAEMD